MWNTRLSLSMPGPEGYSTMTKSEISHPRFTVEFKRHICSRASLFKKWNKTTWSDNTDALNLGLKAPSPATAPLVLLLPVLNLWPCHKWKEQPNLSKFWSYIYIVPVCLQYCAHKWANWFCTPPCLHTGTSCVFSNWYWSMLYSLHFYD